MKENFNKSFNKQGKESSHPIMSKNQNVQDENELRVQHACDNEDQQACDDDDQHERENEHQHEHVNEHQDHHEHDEGAVASLVAVDHVKDQLVRFDVQF